MEKQVLTEEEVKSLTSLQQEQNDLLFQLGQVNYQLYFFEREKTRVQNLIEAFEKKQTDSAKQLEEKYGAGTVNLESGEFVKA
jgi:hypothetical protein|tara:strand:+ start:474 stop:722 length:249 start_codon:yes stop_codon:yes gene_type:complete